MGFKIKFELQGEVQLSRKFGKIADGVKDFSQPFHEAALLLEDAFEQSFDYSGSNIGQSWPPLKPATLKQKASGMPMLVRTGYMRGAFQNISDMTSCKIWNTANYFKYHQSNQPRTKIPRRAMMNLTQEMKQSVVKLFHVYLDNLIND